MKQLKNYNSYVLRRVLPMVIIFFSLQILTRIILLIWEFSNIEITFFEILKLLVVGSWFDFTTLSFFLIPYILYLVALPKKLHLGKFDHVFTQICYFILIYLLTYNVVSELVFWNEFHVRYNFIAVDYLIYTDEVLANIWQSYPVVWLLIAIALISSIIYYYTKNLLIFKISQKTPNLAVKTLHGLIYAVLVTSLFFASNLRYAEISLNNYVNEITKNGVFSLFSAFRNNELEYERFYLTSYKDKKLPSIQDLVAQDGEKAIFNDKDPNDITRLILANGEDLKKNVIIVMIESFSADFMDRFGGKSFGKGLTPNLDALSEKSLFFTNFFATGTRTVRGMEALTLSIPPTPGRSIVKRKNNENLTSLGFVFKDRGYDTKFIYGGYGYFDNMNYFYSNNGFDIVDRKDFLSDEQTFANAWGLCDEDLYNKTLKEANKSYQNNQNFMFMVMTSSNHRPYTFPENDADIPTKGGGRVAGIKYTDYAIGKFLENVKKQPWFDDTIFVFVADHTAGSAGRLELTEEKYHIPLLIYSPSTIKSKTFDKYMSQIDLAPTLLGLLNFSYYSRFYGKNVLKEGSYEPRSFIANYQKIGYKKDGILSILKPGQTFAQYDHEEKLLKNVEDKLLLEAISYYNHASNWRTNFQRVNTLTGEAIK